MFPEPRLGHLAAELPALMIMRGCAMPSSSSTSAESRTDNELRLWFWYMIEHSTVSHAIIRRGEPRVLLTPNSLLPGQQQQHHPRPRRGVSSTQILNSLVLLVSVCCLKRGWLHVFILLGYGISIGLLC